MGARLGDFQMRGLVFAAGNYTARPPRTPAGPSLTRPPSHASAPAARTSVLPFAHHRPTFIIGNNCQEGAGCGMVGEVFLNSGK